MAATGLTVTQTHETPATGSPRDLDADPRAVTDDDVVALLADLCADRGLTLPDPLRALAVERPDALRNAIVRGNLRRSLLGLDGPRLSGPSRPGFGPRRDALGGAARLSTSAGVNYPC